MRVWREGLGSRGGVGVHTMHASGWHRRRMRRRVAAVRAVQGRCLSRRLMAHRGCLRLHPPPRISARALGAALICPHVRLVRLLRPCGLPHASAATIASNHPTKGARAGEERGSIVPLARAPVPAAGRQACVPAHANGCSCTGEPQHARGGRKGSRCWRWAHRCRLPRWPVRWRAAPRTGRAAGAADASGPGIGCGGKPAPT